MPIRFQRSVCSLLAVLLVHDLSCAEEALCRQPIPLASESAGSGIEPIQLKSMYRGAASCAAAACHGGPLPAQSSDLSVRGSEYSLWLERDPHANSWRTFCSDTSLQIMTKLGIIRHGEVAEPDAYKNCLACHNTTTDLTHDALTPSLAEGVGCESCHGPSTDWYDQHFRSAPQQFDGVHNKVNAIDGLVQRAGSCAICHVGGKDRDMNHDIIAAGHPALYFDMASFHDRYPKHWRDSNDSSGDFRARLWMAGQIAIAGAELELLLARVTLSHSVSKWPELSVFNCSSCHFELTTRQNAKIGADPAATVSGRAGLRTWNLGGVEALQRLFADEDASAVNSAVDRLARLLGESNLTRSSIEQAGTDARQLLDKLVQRAADRNLTIWNSQKQAELAADLLRRSETTSDWERASRAYTASWAALAPSSADPQHKIPQYTAPAERAFRAAPKISPQTRQDLATFRQGLLFPPNSQSPRFPLADTPASHPSKRHWEAARLKAASQFELQRP